MRPLWVFGYGSLLFRPDFAHEARHVAVVRGWARRFHQGSPDHRGTPTRPGRVVTLLKDEGAVTRGAVFRVAARDAERVLVALDYREKGGYERVEVDAELVVDEEARIERVRAVTWVAHPDNPNHLGPADLSAMVAQIRASVGPSGPNVEYVLRLSETLRGWGIEDPHVEEVAAALRRG